MNMEQENSIFNLSIGQAAKSHLADVAKWARFLAVAGMFILGLGLLFTVLSVTLLSDKMVFTTVDGNKEQMTTGMLASLAIVSIVFIGIAFCPLLFLLRFSGRLKKALDANAEEVLIEAFANLRKYFRFLGIVLVIIIVLYALGLGLPLLLNA